MASMETTSPNAAIAEAVRRVVEVAQPERIVLFGSAAKGDARHCGRARKNLSCTWSSMVWYTVGVSAMRSTIRYSS